MMLKYGTVIVLKLMWLMYGNCPKTDDAQVQ